MTNSTDLVATLVATFDLPADRPLPIRNSDRFSLGVGGKTYPCVVESVESGMIEPGRKGTLTLRAIFQKADLIPQQGEELELRRGPNVIATGWLIHPPSSG
jgi:hypothetical protein